MKPYSVSIMVDVTPMLSLDPIGPFGVLMIGPYGKTYGVEVQPYRKQWHMDITWQGERLSEFAIEAQ